MSPAFPPPDGEPVRADVPMGAGVPGGASVPGGVGVPVRDGVSVDARVLVGDGVPETVGVPGSDEVPQGAGVPEPTEAPITPRTRRWLIAGWVSVLAAALVWCVVNVTTGVSWQAWRAPTIPVEQSWQAGAVTLTAGEVMTRTAIPKTYGDPVTPAPGAVFVVVTVDYTLDSPDVSRTCGMTLLGRDREWSPAIVAAAAQDIAPDTVSNCSNTNLKGDPTAAGTMAALFEVPADAVDELRAVRVTVFTFDTLTMSFTHLFDQPSLTANLALPR